MLVRLGFCPPLRYPNLAQPNVCPLEKQHVLKLGLCPLPLLPHVCPHENNTKLRALAQPPLSQSCHTTPAELRGK